MRIAALVKQIPKFEAMRLGNDGRLVRDGHELEMNAYCRRAVAQAVHFAAETAGTSVTIISMGPPSADDCLREAIAWGVDHGVDDIAGVLVSDPGFAGSDTLATARALRATIEHLGGFDLVLCGRNSVDADTGQVGPQLAELLGVVFVSAAKQLKLTGTTINAVSEGDDGFVELTTNLPAVISCAERLIDPSKMDPERRSAVAGSRIRTLTTRDLGPGPWGERASPTWVGATRVINCHRRQVRDAAQTLEQQVGTAVSIAHELGAFAADRALRTGTLREAVVHDAKISTVAVLVEPQRQHLTAELIGAATMLAPPDAAVIAVAVETQHRTHHRVDDQLGSMGADAVAFLPGAECEDDAACAMGAFLETLHPAIVLAPSTTWGREIAARVATRLNAGLCGDAVELELDNEGRLRAWKPAFGGALVASIGYRSPIQMATVRAGVMVAPSPRDFVAPIDCFDGWANESKLLRNRVTVQRRQRDDDLDRLADAHAVIAVGRGVDPNGYDGLSALRDAIDGQFAATRKVTDNGWMPRARQLGITGRSIAPRLLISIGAGGKFNHSVGFRNTGAVIAINSDPDAAIFEYADAGIVARWQDAVPQLVAELQRQGLSGR